MCAEFERSHFAGLTKNTVRGHRTYLKQLKAFFGESKLDRITLEMIEDFRDQRRRQPTKLNANRTIKGATVNRELDVEEEELVAEFKELRRRGKGASR